MNDGDEVEVTNRDGSTARGTLLDVLPITVLDYAKMNKNLPDHWPPASDDERVALVDLDDGRRVTHPEDKVRVIAGA